MSSEAPTRIPQLDGFRGVAVLLVLLGHTATGASPADVVAFDWWNGGGGGFIGVQMFFVLSGFLITGVLLRERDRTSSIRFRAFYVRRIRRLVPALVVVTGAYVVYALAANMGKREAFGPALRSLTYTSNLPFLESSVPAGWLHHTWSLGVEEQFYLLWPLLLFFAAKRSRNTIAWVAIAGVVITVLARSLIHMSHPYMYNLARWDALLIGCAVAARPIRLPRVTGYIGWVVIGWYTFATLGAVTPNDYTFTTVASAAALILAVGSSPTRSKVLTHPVLRWFGLISYGLYLWSVLIFRLGPHPLVGATVSIGLAAASFYVVERRFLRPQPLDRITPAN